MLVNHLTVKDDDHVAVKRFKQVVSAELNRRFEPSSLDTAESLPVLCAAVDPRYAHLRFLSEQQKEIAYREVAKKMEHVRKTMEDDETIIIDEDEPSAKKQER